MQVCCGDTQASDSPSCSSLSTSTFSTTSSSLGRYTFSSLRSPANYRGPVAPIRGTRLSAPRYSYQIKIKTAFVFFLFKQGFFPSSTIFCLSLCQTVWVCVCVCNKRKRELDKDRSYEQCLVDYVRYNRWVTSSTAAFTSSTIGAATVSTTTRFWPFRRRPTITTAANYSMPLNSRLITRRLRGSTLCEWYGGRIPPQLIS